MWSLRELFDDIPVVHVLDVGAALGERPAYQSLVEAGAARISGFEPVPAEREKLVARYGPPHRFYPDFVGDGRPHTFYETRWSLTGSLFEPNQELNAKFQALAEPTAPVRTHAVRTTRLDDVAGLDDVDFVKIDVQGAELMVFENALRVLSQVVLVQTEVEFVELYRKQPLFADVDRHLRAAGFQFHTFLGFGSRAFKPLLKKAQKEAGFRQLLWSDAVYVRDFMRLALLPEAKLKKLALLLHDLYQSFDLCHLVLAELDRRGTGHGATRYLRRLAASSAPQT
jgi:FkbM family methyltransferase